MSDTETLPSQPRSTVPTEAEGQARSVGDLTVVDTEGGEGLHARSLDEAVDQFAVEGKRLTTFTLFRFIAVWARDYKARVEENSSLREKVARLEAQRDERSRFKTLVSFSQTGGTAIILLGIGLIAEQHYGFGLTLIAIGAVLLGTAIWVNRGNPA